MSERVQLTVRLSATQHAQLEAIQRRMYPHEGGTVSNVLRHVIGEGLRATSEALDALAAIDKRKATKAPTVDAFDRRARARGGRA